MNQVPSIAPAASRPWSGRLSVGLGGLLVGVAACLGGLALAGRLPRGPADPAPAPAARERPAPRAVKAPGRYRIEKIDDAREILLRTGRVGFFDTPVVDAWVFRYSGGLVECKLETESEGETISTGAIPREWTKLLGDDDSFKKGGASLDRAGYIVLTANEPQTVPELLAPCQVHLGALVALAPYGPLHALTPLHLEVRQQRSYRLFLSAAPLDAEATAGRRGGPSAGFNLRSETVVRITAPLVAREPATEDHHAGGGRNLEPGKEEIILDRQRGFTRVRLKARFLGDGEVRELLPR